MDRLSVEFHPEAVAEARAAREWYEARSSEAAKAFISELDEAVEQVAQFPDRWAKYISGTQHYLLRRFPYVVIYRRKTESVQVIAVAHEKRNPGYWKARLNQ